MAIHDPLFSPEQDPSPRPWWRHPALLVLALMGVAAVLAWLTGKPREQPAPQPIEVEFKVLYDEGDMSVD